MADNSGGAEAGRPVPFGIPGDNSNFGLAGGADPIPPIDPNHAASERWIVRNAFPISNDSATSGVEGDDAPNVPSPNEQIGVPQDISPPAPKMPINHGSVSLSDEEVVLS